MSTRDGGIRLATLGVALVTVVGLSGCGGGAVAGGGATATPPAKSPLTSAAQSSPVPAGMPTATSLKGWHVSSTGHVAIAQGAGDPSGPALVLPGDGESYVWADLGQPIDHFSFDVKTQGLFDFFFGANDSGQGNMFRIDTRGGTDYSGFSTTLSWTQWNCPGKGINTDPASVWLHVNLTIAGTNVTAQVTGKSVNQTFLFAAPTIVGCTASGQPQVLVAYKPVGTAFGFQGDGLGSSSDTWIANFR